MEKEKFNVLFVSRHEPQPIQLRILRDLGMERLEKFTEKVENVKDLVKLAKEKKIDVIIPVLPVSLLIPLVQEAKKEGIEVWVWEMTREFVFDQKKIEEFKKAGFTVDQDLTSGKTVVFIPRKLLRIEKIEIIQKPLWEAPERKE